MELQRGFGDWPWEFAMYERAKAVLVPVPYDETSTGVKGAVKGPAAIIEASSNLENYDIETECEVYRVGIATDEPVEAGRRPEDMVEAVKERVARHLEKDKFVVVIGGEHSVSIGCVAAHVERFEDVTVLQLDAHGDLRDEYQGSKYNHACVMARVREMAPVVQVGIRSMDAAELPAVEKGRIFFAKDIYNHRDWIVDVVEKLSSKVYITVDLDVFDPSIMPSTGTPEPGGLGWYDVLALLREVSERRDVVGFDVVELCPNAANKAPDFLAAKLVYKILTYKFGRENN
jgi:agmatinase